MAAGYDGSIRIDTSIDSSGFNTGIGKLKDSLKGLAEAVGIAFGVKALFDFMKSSAEAASEVEVMTNKFHAVFGGLSDDVEKQLGVIADATNFAKDDLMGFASTVQATFLALKMPGQQASDMSVRVVKLAQDLATFNGMNTSDVIGAIQSSMMGYTRELRQFGVVADDTTIKSKALAMGLWDGAGAMSAQAKATAILQILTDSTAFAQGNAQKTAHTWAGEMRGLTASWQEFKEAVGRMVTVFAPVVGVIRQTIQWLTVLANEFAQFVSLLFGVSIDTSSMASGIQDAAGAAGDLADNTAAAGKAAKGALASFDQINVLQQSAAAATSPSSGGGGGSGITPYIPDTSGLDAIKEKVAAFKDALIQLLAPASAAFDRLKTALEPLGKTIWDGLKWAWDNILVPLGKWTATELAPHILDLLGAASKALNSALVALKPLWDWIWEHLFKPVAIWTGGAILDILKWLTDRLNDFSNWVNGNQDVVQNIAKVIGIFAAAWGLVNLAIGIWNVIGLIATGVTAAFGAAVAFLTSPIGLAVLAIAAIIAIIILLITHWGEVKTVASNAWAWIVSVWNGAGPWFKANVTDPVANWFSQAWANVKQWIGEAWQKIVDVWNGAGAWIKANVTDPVSGWFKGAWDNIKQWIGETWDKVTGVWTGAGTWIQTNVTDPIKTAFGTALDWISGKWSDIFGDKGIKGFVKGFVNSVIDLINGMMSAIAGGLNSVIGSLNSIHVTVPSWIPGFGGQSWGVNIANVSAPQIPHLATGAVIPANSAFVAVLGEQRTGTNIEAPEALLRQIVREESAQQQSDIHIHFDGTMGELVRMLKPAIDRENVRVGGNLIKRQGGPVLS
jgi:hypothetical protein